TRQQVEPLVHLAQQKRSTVGTDRPAVKTGHDLPPPRPFKSETRLVTLCHSGGRPFLALTVVWKLSYAIEDGHLPIPREKSGLGHRLSPVAQGRKRSLICLCNHDGKEILQRGGGVMRFCNIT